MPPEKSLPMPSHHAPSHAADFHHLPDVGALLPAAAAWRTEHGLTPAATDAFNLQLLLIDVQKDFCFPQGSLYVGGRSGRGALDDSRRICEFIYRYLGRLTRVTATLDTHLAQQIFFPSFWQDADGAPLSPHRVLTVADLKSGRVQPVPALARWLLPEGSNSLEEEALHYCQALERAGKYELYLWPPHCLLGSAGHALVGAVHEALLFHAFARSTQTCLELKGMDPMTESYSALGPEVPLGARGQPLGQKNARLLDALLASDALIVAGQASSHCVKSTLEDLLDAAHVRPGDWVDRVYLLTDCMSPVAVPDGRGGFVADFTEAADAAMKRLEDAGMHRVLSTQPMSSWPGPLGRMSA